MGNFIEINLLKAYGVSNLNRDENGNVKTAYVGGDVRTRVSSQSLKRAIRDNMSDPSIHTRHLVSLLMNRFKDEHPQATADDLVRVCTAFGVFTESTLDKKGHIDPDTRTWGYMHSQVLTYTKAEVMAIYDAVSSNPALIDRLNASDKLSPADLSLRADTLKRAGLDLETSLFGRMTAAGPGETVSSATHFNHEYSVDSNNDEYDFFTAIDTYLREIDESGSAHLNQASFSSNVLYGYMNINPDQMYENLISGIDSLPEEEQRARKKAAVEMVKDGVAELMKLYLLHNPSGKQNSMSSFPPVSIASISFVEGGFPCTMDNCFNKVIRATEDQGITGIAGDRIVDFIRSDRYNQNYSVDTLLIDSVTQADMTKLAELPKSVEVNPVRDFDKVIKKIIERIDVILRNRVEE